MSQPQRTSPTTVASTLCTLTIKWGENNTVPLTVPAVAYSLHSIFMWGFKE